MALIGCSFRPETLSCLPNQDSATCLSLIQIDTIRRLYTDYYETNQTYIFGGWYPGAELGMPMYIFNPEPAPFATEAYRYMIAK